MHHGSFLLGAVLGFALVAPGWAQFKEDAVPGDSAKSKPARGKSGAKPGEKPAGSLTEGVGEKSQGKSAGPKLDKELVQRIRFGVEVTAGGMNCSGLYGTVPVPLDWPEQSVKIIDEDITKGASKIQYRMVDGTVKQMQVRIPLLKAKETAKVLVTLEVKRRSLLPPDDTSRLAVPGKVDATLKRYLAPSPMIESTDKRIVAEAKAIAGAHDGGWKKVEAIYDYVRERVEYRNGPLRGALAAYKDRWGDCEDMSSLFIAMCRAIGVPARTVWVPGHCYPEFYLVDDAGQGYWFPCQAAGSRAFGGIPEQRPILQKGDNFKDTDRPREKMRYMSEHFTCQVVKGFQPTVRFIREDVATDKPVHDSQDPDAGKPKEDAQE